MRREVDPTYRLAVVNSHPIQYFAPFYRHMARAPDIDLTVYYCSRAGVGEYVDAGFGLEISWDIPLLDGYQHSFLPNMRSECQPEGFWSLMNAGIVGELRRQQYDAVVLHGHNYATYLMAILGGRLGGSALLMRCDTHLGLRRRPLRRLLRKPIMTAFYTVFDGFLAIGSRNEAFYLHHGVPENRVFRVPYAVDNAFFGEAAQLSPDEKEQARRELGLPTATVPLVLYLSKLQRLKRPMDLLLAFRRFRDEGVVRAALAFVGAGEEEDRLRRVAELHRIPDVHFLGFRNQSELPTVYGASDLFVLPSEDEAWGLVVNEAMAAGLPVIVSDAVGAARDLVKDGRNGFVFPAGDIAELAERLGRVTGDAELRRHMGDTSREIISDWTFEAGVDGVRAALRSVTLSS